MTQPNPRPLKSWEAQLALKHAKAKWPKFMRSEGCRTVSRAKVVDLMQVVLDHYRWTDGVVFLGFHKTASAAGLCDLTGQSSATVRAGLAWLIKHRYLKRVARHGFNGSANMPTAYALNVETLRRLIGVEDFRGEKVQPAEKTPRREERVAENRTEDFRGGVEDFRGEQFFTPGPISETTGTEEKKNAHAGVMTVLTLAWQITTHGDSASPPNGYGPVKRAGSPWEAGVTPATLESWWAAVLGTVVSGFMLRAFKDSEPRLDNGRLVVSFRQRASHHMALNFEVQLRERISEWFTPLDVVLLLEDEPKLRVLSRESAS